MCLLAKPFNYNILAKTYRPFQYFGEDPPLRTRAGPRHRLVVRRPRAHFILSRGTYIAIHGLKGVYIEICAKRAQTFTRFEPISHFTLLFSHPLNTKLRSKT